MNGGVTLSNVWEKLKFHLEDHDFVCGHGEFGTSLRSKL
jgi:hypothetical protein